MVNEMNIRKSIAFIGLGMAAAIGMSGYTVIDTVRVRVYEATAFPTERDAYGSLFMEAKRIGADAVIGFKYMPNREKRYADAEGIAIKFKEEKK